jgi:hypothetical protein
MTLIDVVHTYFENITPEGPEADRILSDRQATLDLWATSWRDQGWEAVVLGRSDAERHPLYKTMMSRIDSYPTVNDKRYETACYLRWLALDAVSGSFMTDYDVLNFALPVRDERILALLHGDPTVPVVLDRGRTPCAVFFPSPSARSVVIEALLDEDQVLASAIDVDGRPHVSDMTLFQASRLGRVRLLCDLEQARRPLRHFASVVSGGPAGKLGAMAAAYTNERSLNRRRRPNQAPVWRRNFVELLIDNKHLVLEGGQASELALEAELGSHEARLSLHEVLTSDHRVQDKWSSLAAALAASALFDGLSAHQIARLLMVPEYVLRGATLEKQLTWGLASTHFQAVYPTLLKQSLGVGVWRYFMHMPRTGGATASLACELDGPPGSHFRIAGPHGVEPAQHPFAFVRFAELLLTEDAPRVTVSGRTTLDVLSPREVRWPTDETFTIIRDPLAQLLSLLNHHLQSNVVESVEGQTFWDGLGVVSSQGGMDPRTLASKLHRCVADLRPSTYLCRTGMSLNEVLSDGRIAVGTTEALPEFLEALVPNGWLALQKLRPAPATFFSAPLAVTPATFVDLEWRRLSAELGDVFEEQHLLQSWVGRHP